MYCKFGGDTCIGLEDIARKREEGSRLEKPGWTGKDLPLRAPVIPSPGWDRGDLLYNENGLFLLLLDCFFFSNCNSCIAGFGPFDTLRDPFPRGPPKA